MLPNSLDYDFVCFYLVHYNISLPPSFLPISLQAYETGCLVNLVPCARPTCRPERRLASPCGRSRSRRHELSWTCRLLFVTDRNQQCCSLTGSVLHLTGNRIYCWGGQTLEPKGRARECRCFAGPEAGQRNISEVLFNKQGSVCIQQMSLSTTLLGQAVLLAAAF